MVRGPALAHPVEGVRLLGLVALLLRELREVLRGRLPVDEGVIPGLRNTLIKEVGTGYCTFLRLCTGAD